jgi:hypothetical protein
MSLSLLLLRPDVKRQLAGVIRMPAANETFYGLLRVPPRTDFSPLIGTAFDYLMRFRLEALNPTIMSRAWVADAALTYAQSRAKSAPSAGGTAWRVVALRIADILAGCHQQHQDYVRSGAITEELLSAAFELAQLDHLVRSRSESFCLRQPGYSFGWPGGWGSKVGGSQRCRTYAEQI